MGAALAAGLLTGAVGGGATGTRPSPGVHAALTPLGNIDLSAEVTPEPAGVAEPDGSLYTLNGSWPAIGRLSHPVVGWAPRPGGGAWEVASDGGVFSRNGAPFYGSTGALRLTHPVVGVAATRSGHGYWLVASDGGVFAFGDARFYGSTGALRLTDPVVGMAATPSGHGYWLVASDGGVFPFGDARFYGSTGNIRLAAPIAGMVSTSSGNGYWLVASDGGVFTFGRAGFLGTAVGRDRAGAVAAASAAGGYDEILADGAVWQFRPGQAPVAQHLPIPASELAPARAESVALAQVGKPYVYGAAGPGAFDCSGLTQYAYGQAGISLPRNTAQQISAGRPVAASDLRPGDLVFFYPGIEHVGIYVGNGNMVDAPHTGAAVRVESMKWFGPLMGASRPGA